MRKILIISTLIFLIIFIFSFYIGQQKIGIKSINSFIWDSLSGRQSNQNEDFDLIKTILFQIRLPRILGATLAGLVLAISGAILQGIFNNPLASPYLLGISNGAGFAAALAILLDLSKLYIQLFSFFGGILAALLSVFLASIFISKEKNIIILAGVLVGNLFAAFTMYLKMVADPVSKLPAVVYWMMGSFANTTMKDIIYSLPIITISIFFCFLLSWKFNILSYGDSHALSLGESPVLLRLIALLLTTMATSAVISYSGIIGWIGVVIPQIARLRVGPDYRKLLPISLLWGASFTLFIDDVCRIFRGYELPAGIASAIIGIPFVFFMIFKRDV
ncbi:MAG: iron ABC transporter permease [Spirochaetes bacterium]|jgi:iron complex transport system permease protein|nr:iron ABC transporter permease [Spirochaetota bacterium]HOV46442.1 iron ABC transporter permease [Exilispira sp.]